jgi:PDZ domain-containing protein
MAVGFMALFKGDPIHRDIALTGTLNPDGNMGPVESIPEDSGRLPGRLSHHSHSGRTIGQSRVDLVRLGMELNVDVRRRAQSKRPIG